MSFFEKINGFFASNTGASGVDRTAPKPEPKPPAAHLLDGWAAADAGSLLATSPTQRASTGNTTERSAPAVVPAVTQAPARPTPEVALDQTPHEPYVESPEARRGIAAGQPNTLPADDVSPTVADPLQMFSVPGFGLTPAALLDDSASIDAETRAAADVRDRDIRAAIDAESRYQQIVNEPYVGQFIGSADSFERRVSSARDTAEQEWDDVANSFDHEFDTLGVNVPPLLQTEEMDAYQSNLDFSEFDPVFHSHIRHSAGLGDAPGALDDASIRTNIAATNFIEEQEQLDTLTAAEPPIAPAIIDGNLIASPSSLPSAEIVEQRARVDEAENALTRIATLEQRQAARDYDAELGLDPYRLHSTTIESRFDYLGMDNTDNARIVADAQMQARAAEPLDLNESRAQTNAVIWDAIDAENAFVEHAASEGEAQNPEAIERWQARFAELEAQSSTAWNDVYFQSGLEVRMFSDQGGDNDVNLSAEDYAASIHERAFEEIYQPKIGLFTNKPPLSDAFFLDSEEVAQVYIDRIDEAYEEGGSDALLIELESMSEDLLENPYIAGDDTFTPDSLESNRRLAEVQLDIAAEIQPHYELLADSLNSDLQTIIDDGDPRDQTHETDLAVATRLERTVDVLPRNMAAAAVIDSQSIWAPSLADTTAELETDTISYDYGVRMENEIATYRSYARISDAVVENVEDGEEAFTLIADVIHQTIVDSENESTPYFHSIAGAAKEGEGFHLGVETVNRLSADASTQDEARVVLTTLDQGTSLFIDNVESDIRDWSENREEFDRLLSEAYNFSNTSNGRDLLQPGQIDAASLDIEAAIAEYKFNNSDVMENDTRMMVELMQHGGSLYALEVASAQLSDEAFQVADADRLTDRVANFVNNNPAAQALADSPLPMVTLNNQISDLIERGDLDPNELDFTSDQTLAASLATFANNELSIPRNLRFMVIEWSKGFRENSPAPIPGELLNNTIGRWSGPGLFTIASAASGYEALANPGDASGSDRLVSGLRSANYAYLSGRDVLTLSSNHYLSKHGANKVTGGIVGYLTQDTMLGIRLDRTQPDAPTRKLQGTKQLWGPRMAFVAFDAYNILSTLDDDKSSLQRLGQGLNLAGSLTMLGNAWVSGGLLAAAPVAWIGTGLWVAGSVVSYQADRIANSNRYETNDARLFFSHFGSHDETTGELRAITGDTYVTPFDSHLDEQDDFAEVSVKRSEYSSWRDEDLDALPGNLFETEDGDQFILYRGISASAVDEMMNNSGSPDNPISASEVINALASRNGLDTRTVLLDWYNDKLSPAEQKALPPAAFNVDVDSQDGVQPDFFSIYSYENLIDRVNVERNTITEISPEDALATWDYINDHLAQESDDGQSIRLDDEAVQGALGYGDLTAEQEAPAPEVASTLRKLWFEGNDDYRASLTPTNLDEFEIWLEVNGYAELPAADTSPLAPLPMHPVVTPDFDYRPVNHYYTVQENDSIWEIAGRTLSPTEMNDVIEYHNLNVEPLPENFDAARADSDFFTPVTFADFRRDPDLIHPGEVIFVRNADAISEAEAAVG